MAPPKKKRRMVESEANANASCMDIAQDNNDSSTPAAQISSKDLLKKELMSQLDDLESGNVDASNNASITLLRLKSLQRSILEKMRKTQQVLRQQAIARDQQELQLENLRYQHSIHQTSQQRSDRAVESTVLEIARLVRRSQSDTTTEQNHDDDDDDSGLLTNFLGDDWKDPSRRQAIVAKLNEEVSTRKRLEDELNNLKADRKSMQDSLASRQKLLKDLPSKLADMEKASLSLQKFFQKQSSASSSPSLMEAAPRMGTTKRRNRLDLAKSLPKALYTLFHQLQSCLDVMETTQGSLETTDMAPEALPMVEIQGTESSGKETVTLKIPIPTLSPGGGMSYKPKKLASIVFRYDSGLDLVLAACGNDYDMGKGVIDELFPGDKGEFVWSRNPGDVVVVEKDASLGGRPYQWCNYLGGLHISPGEQTAARMHSSARVIVRALVRRVRATATLSWILHGLSRKPTAPNFPRHPALRGDEEERESTTKLSSWTAWKPNRGAKDDTAGDTEHKFLRVYKAVLQHGSGEASQKVVAKVTINLARYPSSIPQWRILSSPNEDQEDEEDSLRVLQGGQEGEAPQELPLYNEALARLEQEVNQKVDQLVISSDQTTYDWILAHQLANIAKGWEDSLQESTP